MSFGNLRLPVAVIFLFVATPMLAEEAASQTKAETPAEAAQVEVEDSGQKGVELASADQSVADTPRVYGWKEWILFEGKTKAMRAKFDSGAKTSSIHAEKVKGFEKDGEKWVSFTVFDPNRPAEKADPVVYECRMTRMARIRNADGDQSERRVVELDFWIGGEKRRAEFTLNDRGDMINPVLLGRSVIQTLGLIDTGKTYLCGSMPKKPPVQKKNSIPAPEESEEEAGSTDSEAGQAKEEAS